MCQIFELSRKNDKVRYKKYLILRNLGNAQKHLWTKKQKWMVVICETHLCKMHKVWE